MRYFHIWKFDPSFSSDGMSYRQLEACLPLEVEAVETEGKARDID
jgi:hypothetical protein